MSMFRKNIFLVIAAFVIFAAALSGVATTSFASHVQPIDLAAPMDGTTHDDHGSAHHKMAADEDERGAQASMDHCAGQAMGACCPMLSLPTFQGVETVGNTVGYRHAFDLSLNRADLGTLKRPPRA